MHQMSTPYNLCLIVVSESPTSEEVIRAAMRMPDRPCGTGGAWCYQEGPFPGAKLASSRLSLIPSPTRVGLICLLWPLFRKNQIGWLVVRAGHARPMPYERCCGKTEVRGAGSAESASAAWRPNGNHSRRLCAQLVRPWFP